MPRPVRRAGGRAGEPGRRVRPRTHAAEPVPRRALRAVRGHVCAAALTAASRRLPVVAVLRRALLLRHFLRRGPARRGDADHGGGHWPPLGDAARRGGGRLAGGVRRLPRLRHAAVEDLGRGALRRLAAHRPHGRGRRSCQRSLPAPRLAAANCKYDSVRVRECCGHLHA